MAILKIRDNEGVITNIAAIRGENGKSPIIKMVHGGHMMMIKGNM